MNFSTGLITCSICHNPHAEAGTKLVRAATAGDLICQQCHQQWFVLNDSSDGNPLNDTNAHLTHPVVGGNYLADFANLPDARFKPATADANGRLSTNVDFGDVRLVNDGISCTSCHATHYADSSSGTPDGKTTYNDGSMAAGDGKLLRSDGAKREVLPYNAANSSLQAQLRSNLCQACHAYQTHGKSGYEPTNDLDAVDETVGCLVCHSGHSFNAGIPNYFVLRGTVTTASFGPDKTTLYTTNPTTWETYCTSCHGSVSGFPTTLRTHTTGENCKGCHAHDGAYSFAMGDNATICGDCHGAPPRANAPAVPGDLLIDTGYAVGPDVNYLSSGQNSKDETRTPHKIHAGALNGDKAVVDYAFGSTASGLVSACLPCHNDQPDTVTPTHSTGTSAGSFQSVYFSPFATYNGVLTGQTYPLSGGSAWKCSNVYCHSNGGKRNATGTKVVADFSVTPANLTPAWDLGSNAYPTPGTIVGTATECQKCHGENSATMLGTAKNNSPTHDKHLNKLNSGLNNKTTCYICHSDTVDATGVVPATARDIRAGGKHVNGAADVVFSSTALGGNLATGVYTGGASGTCTVYCHSNGGSTSAPLVYATPDWDLAASGACNTCHLTTTLASGAHSRHLAATGANIKCDSCHGANAALGTHAGHVDGTLYYDTTACDTCHGVEAGEGGTPVWSNVPASQNLHCETCHTGALRTSYTDASSVVRTAPNKATATSLGHNKASGFYSNGAGGNGNPAANQACASCHDSTYSATHTDAPKGDQRLIGGFSCATCHGTINTHQAKACVACHDPHGSGANIYMMRGTNSTDFGGTVVFTATSGADSYDEVDVNNTDDICATCHTATTHNNRARTGTHLDAQTHEGEDCFTSCHKTHTDASPFSGAGNACNGCHGNPPTTSAQMPHGGNAGPHALHAISATHDKDNPLHDATDCAFCHPGAENYTYTLLGVTPTHGNGSVTLAAGISGGAAGCTAACHASTAGDGFWADTALGGNAGNGLNCTACHGYPPAGNNHSKHITAGMTCAGCHVGVDAAGTSPLTHADLGDTTGAGDDPATDILKIQHKGNGFVNVSGLDAELDDSVWNVGAGTTWVNGAGTTNNTCSNTKCHDPSNAGTTVDWDTSVASCSLCHGAGTTMTSGSHSLHLNNAAVIGDNFACTVCHPDNSVPGTDHTLTGGNVQGVVTVAGSKVNTYGGEVNLPTSAYGTCTASQCHNDGKGANIASPAWGRVPQSGDDCTICHGAPPTTGDHGNGSAGHWQPARTTLGLSCVSCHNGTAASNTAIKAGSLHLNGNSYNVSAGGNYNAVGVTISSYVQGSPSTCTASCHAANPKNWAAANSCEDCHAAKIAEPRHARHVNVLPSIDADKTDCAQCHPNAGSYTIGGGHADHQNAATTLSASIVNLGGGNYSCNALCHLSSAGDGSWTDAGGLNCDACHYYSASPSSPTTLSSSHNKHFDKSKVCTDCHALADGSIPTPGPLSHITASGANEGAILAGKAQALRNEATLTFGGATSYTYAYGAADAGGPNSTCSSPTNNGLGCHASGTADWDVAITTCTACHTAENPDAVSGNLSNPYSGLHNFSTALRHDDTLQTGNCVNCHDSAAPSGILHQNGTRESWSAAFTFHATNVVSYNSAVGCAATCHLDGGDWDRAWNTAVNAKPQPTDDPATANVCGNCHGTFFKGWNGVTTSHVNPDPDNPGDGMSNHSNCETCHGWGNGNYNAVWLGSYNATYVGHGDANITMNGPVGTGTGYNNATGGCDTSNCHGAYTLTMATTNSWGTNINYGTFGAGSACDACHGGAGEYAPNSTAYPNRAGKHSEHVQAVAVKLGGNTLTNRNASCNYCHLNPGETGHNDNISPANVDNIRRIVDGVADSNEVINGGGTSYVTCSNIDCHFDMPRTPHWYTDDIAPAQVTLTALAGPKPRSIKVSWTAPGDDNNVADTTPYVYDLRYGTSAAIATDFVRTDNYAGNLPAAYKQGSASEAVVENLTVGTTYYFSLKTRDTQGNWSTASAAVSALPTTDTLAPAFGGADKAAKADSSASVYLTWTPAEDHTMPITYKVWRKAESAGALDMDVDTPLLTGVKGHGILLTSAAPDALVDDTIYNFGVRACDANNNCDTNTQIVSATPTAEPLVTKTNHTYRTNGSLTLVKDGAAGTAVTAQALPKVFTPAANNTYSVNVFADTFAVDVNASTSGASVIRATLGYSTNGTNFTSLGVTKDITVAKRASRIYQFKLSDMAGKTITAGQRLAVQISLVSGFAVTLDYGSTATRGDLTVAERIVDTLPTNPAVNAVVSGANVNLTWTASTDTADGLSDTVHYDLFGSDDNGATYRYLIATDIPAATTNYSWNTQEAGISGSATVAVKLLPGDGYGHYTGAGTTVTGLAVNNSADNVAPGAIADLQAKARPKAGSVQLIWTAPGDDAANNGRANYYDIRYSTAAINEGNFASATQCVNEPSPDFGGEIQNFEVTGLTPGTTYYFAVKTYDEGGNVSAISTAKTVGSDQAVGGPRCGMCHTTAPSIVESVGNHKLHGFTINDCTKCHGAAVATYGLDHQDGLLKMGYGPGGPLVGTISTTTVANDTITYTDASTLQVMYRDTNGYGGFGNGSYVSVGDGIDNGTCMNFGAMGVGGCHSAAGTDPDGAGPLPDLTPLTPTWTAAATLNCSACHGNPSRTTDSFYGRDFDATVANGMIVPDQIKGAPVIDNHGNYDLADPDEKDRKFIGQHEKHLNYSFRFSKGDSCNLCHSGNYADVNDLDGKHANGEVDVKLDQVAAGPNATWTAGTAITAGTCSSMSPETCHPSASSPKWDSAQSFDCVGCHNMGGNLTNLPVGHYTDPAGGITLDTDPDNTNDGGPMLGNCTWCHFAGHPRDTVGGTALILANSSQVGLNYKSGGIHLRKSIGGRAAQATEAQLCWQCHDANGISEWGADTGANNASTAPPNSSDYNYGQIYTDATYTTPTSNWTSGYWKSSVANFDYKKAAIQSTHSTNELGTSAVTGSLEAYTETKDTVGNIRCSNCHDVHNLNKAPGDAMTGQPYLRGTWIRNPYPEDGAPWNKAYTSVSDFGVVPRGGVLNNQQGGYQIDQNNSYPTAGLSLATSAGLCTLCHGSNVDAMDRPGSENLWVGTNGHSNAALGGTASAAANIFGNGIGGRPTPSGANLLDDTQAAADVSDMGVQYINNNGTPGSTRGYLYRSKRSVKFNPLIAADYAYQRFDWGVTVDATSTDVGYHAFTCSKCHNPHASRLPKLMITNCLDTRHNTWQNSQGSIQNFWSSTADNGEYTATHNTAQNCHRYDSVDNLGGWNKVTPW